MSLGKTRDGLFDRVLTTFLTGVIGLLPLALTFGIFAWLVSFIHDCAGPRSYLGHILRSLGMTVTACEVTGYIIGLLVATLFIFLLGWMFEEGKGRRISSAVDRAVTRVPLVSTVYDASKNLTSLFVRKQDSMQSMTPVMCYFGESMGVGTPALMPTADLVYLGGQPYHIVIVPTAPVPFGGALLCVRADWVQPATCSFDELLGIYMSMGVSAPDCLKDDRAAAKSSGANPTSMP